MTTPAPEPETANPGPQPPAAEADRRTGHIPAGPRGEPSNANTDWLRQIRWQRW